MDGKGIRAWSRRNRRVVKASSRLVKEFEDGEGKIKGGSDMFRLHCYIYEQGFLIHIKCTLDLSVVVVLVVVVVVVFVVVVVVSKIIVKSE